MSQVNLPVIYQETSSTLEQVTDALGVPRKVLASDEEIANAWGQLPTVLTKIPVALRNELHIRMCVAVAIGLFDAAINYAWNSAVVALRDKVRAFGLNVVSQIKRSTFDEQVLVDLQDGQLLDLCLSLNLVTEDGYFFLDQCRDIRNNFSAAHPPMGSIDDHEFVAFVNRCVKYALGDAQNPKGVNVTALVAAIKGATFTDDQRNEWVLRIAGTHDAQREMIVGMLHGVYCNPSSQQETRVNALSLCEDLAPEFTPKAKSEILNRHSDYVAEGKADRIAASQDFFNKLELLALLTEVEQHAVVSAVCKKLREVHQGLNNFYNEPPFAERLFDISNQLAIPESAQAEFVQTVVLCGTGNPYGLSWGAMPHYRKMVQGFSPKEINLMMSSPDKMSGFSMQLKIHSKCKAAFKELVALLGPTSIPPQAKVAYEKWLKP